MALQMLDCGYHPRPCAKLVYFPTINVDSEMKKLFAQFSDDTKMGRAAICQRYKKNEI